MGAALLRVFAWLAALPYLAVAALVFTGAATWSAVAYVVALGVLLGGLATLPEPEQPPIRKRGLSRLGAAAVLAVAVVRMLTAGHGRTMRLTDAGGASARLVDRLIEEADLSVAAARVLVGSGMLRDDARDLPGAMRGAYARMRDEEGDMPTPQVATLLGLQRPSAFDVVTFDPPEPPRGAVVFLHGSAGNFNLPCWQIARAVAPAGAVTACPSTDWSGEWATPEGEATLRRTVDALRARGLSRIVLMGLSNGGIGASELAPRMKGAFAGLVLFSGAAEHAPTAGVPTLVLHGKHDTHVSPQSSIAYAEATGARYVELDAGHFAMLVRAREVDPLVAAFVGERLAAW